MKQIPIRFCFIPKRSIKLRRNPELIKQKRKFLAIAQTQEMEIAREQEALGDSDSEAFILDFKKEEGPPKTAKTMPKGEGENSSNSAGEEEKGMANE